MIDPKVKTRLGFSEDTADEIVLAKWQEMSTRVCKPCWELKYCPYGPLVEDSPLLPPTRDVAEAHQEYLLDCLRTGVLGSGERLDDRRRLFFTQETVEYEPLDYPAEIPSEISESACSVFGHICPVVFAAEGFTETDKGRRHGRYIPFKTKIRVARRDNYTCQICGRHLLDNELEFDHIIPVSKGGSSEEHNIQLTCFDCNRGKGVDVQL